MSLFWFKKILQNPRQIASVAPSSQYLADKMVSLIPPSGNIIEIGPGTGPITSQMLRQGIDHRRLLLVDFDQDMIIFLKNKYPFIKIAHGDARHLRTISKDYQHGEKVDTVVSSLGLRAMDENMKKEILEEINQVLSPRGVLIQYTYHHQSPIDQKTLDHLGWTKKDHPIVWRNLPPARIFTYHKL